MRRNQGWQDYWKEDREASCVPESATTAGEIGERWIGLFEALPDGSRIIDVATGNGVLLAHAANAAQKGGRTFALTGVDLADIDPVRYVSTLPELAQQADFRGGVAAESLPFPDASFDVAVSQYGLEYADLPKALGEIERVTAPGGRLIWLAHSEQSTVVEQNRDQGAQVEFLLADRGPLRMMAVFVSKLGKQKGLKFAAEKLQASMNEAEAYCREHPPANIVREVCTTLSQVAQRWQAYHPGDLESMLDDSRRRLTLHRQRINDLKASVVTPQREGIIRDRLCAPSWEDLTFEPMSVGAASSPIGTLIRARRAG